MSNKQDLKKRIEQGQKELSNYKNNIGTYDNFYLLLKIALLVFIGYIAFFTIKTMFFELSENGKVAYNVCVEKEYGEESFCIEELIKYTNLEDRIFFHIAIASSISGAILIFAFYFRRIESRWKKENMLNTEKKLLEYNEELERL